MFLSAYVKQPYHPRRWSRSIVLSVTADLYLVQTRIRRNPATRRLLVSLSPRQIRRSRAPVLVGLKVAGATISTEET
jgi:hypothetical protein